jgi:UDP-N-acetyl-2-amino-2-deoxyglucuronate dehydrogenase
MTKVYNIAIAGCGKVAHQHAKAVIEIPNANLVSVWSRSFETASLFAEQYGVRPYATLPEMIKDNAVDLVIICTPHPFHKEPAIISARAGANILVEKPLASTLQDCDEIIKVCSEENVKLGVISQRRWYEPVKRVKDALLAGKIGRPVLGTAVILGWRDKAYYDMDQWRGTWDMEGGGVLVNQAPHQLDILLWYMGEIDEVYGVWKNLNHPFIEVEDTAIAIVKFKNGGVGNILVSNSQKPGIYGKVHIHGENGASVGVQTDGGAMFIAGMTGVLEPPFNDIWTVPGEEHLMGEWKKSDAEFFNSIDPAVYYMKCQIIDFLDALGGNHEPMVNGFDGRNTVELFTAIYRSSRDNIPVKFPLSPEYDRDDMDGRLGLG